MTTETPAEAQIIGCSDGCGAAIKLADVGPRHWVPVQNRWRCFECQRQRSKNERYRAAIKRAYGNQV